MAIFEDAFTYTLKNEGGFSDFVNDGGHATKFGVTQLMLSTYLNRQASADDVKNMTLPTAQNIYEKYFWSPIQGDLIRAQSTATALFDQVVNSGQGNAVKMAQASCGTVVDGIFGQNTLDALNKADPTDFLTAFLLLVENRYRTLAAVDPTQEEFLQGWLNRAERLKTLLNVS